MPWSKIPWQFLNKCEKIKTSITSETCNRHQIPKKKYFFTLPWVGFWLVRKRVNTNNGRWKLIFWINSQLIIKKTLRYGIITWLTSGPILSHSLRNVILVIIASAKSVVNVFLFNCLPELLHDCVPKQQASTFKSNDRIYYCFGSSLWSASNYYYYYIWKLLYSMASPTFHRDI